MTRILVVDDSATIRKVVSAILDRRGYTTAQAADGQAALDAVIAADPPFDLVLLDFVMPKMNGYQFCRAMNDKGIRSPPVVLMSAKSDRIRDQFVHQTGAIDAIAKPFDAEALALVVENAFGRIERGATSASRLPDFDDENTDDSFPLPTDETGAVALTGDVGIIPIGAVMQLLQVEGQSGVITITRESREITIAMRGGLIDLVQSRKAGDEFRLGRYFVGEKLLSEDDLAAILESQKKDPEDSRLLGERLLHDGKITEAQLREALTRQSSELIYELLRWPKGHFEFRRRAVPPLAYHARLAVPVASVVMEGFRRVDEWRVIENKLGSFDLVLVKDAIALEAMKRDDLSRDEIIVIDTIDSKRSIREIIRASHLSSFDACRILGQLLEARVVRTMIK
jgi:CheY-like chemotaxis protein